MKPAQLLVLLTLALMSCQQQSDNATRIRQLPITLRQGYGPFYPGFGILGPERPEDPLWGKIILTTKGSPTHWTQLTQTMVWLDSYQLVYQNVRAGTISEKDYHMLQREWKWTPDTSRLSAAPIKCYVYIIKGFDESRGKWAVLMDTNNDLDFSNETPYYPEPIPLKPIPDKMTNTRMVQYETYQEGRVRRAQLPMVVGTLSGDFVYGSPQCAVATMKQGNTNYELFIASLTGRPSFENAQLCLASSVLPSGKIDPQKLVKLGESIDIGGVLYTNRGVDTYHNWLTLETTDVATAIAAHSLQVGHQFKPFTARDVNTGQPVSLTHLRGKYIYIDFWGTWCKGCVAQIPALKTNYELVDKKRVAFVSIACHNTPAQVHQFVRARHLTWSQIVSDDTNRLAELYEVTSFPTSVLLNPKGIIIARDLHGEELAKKLRELGQMK